MKTKNRGHEIKYHTKMIWQFHWVDWKIIHGYSNIGLQLRHMEKSGQVLSFAASLWPQPDMMMMITTSSSSKKKSVSWLIWMKNNLIYLHSFLKVSFSVLMCILWINKSIQLSSLLWARNFKLMIWIFLWITFFIIIQDGIYI